MTKVWIDTSPLRNQSSTRGIGKYTKLLIKSLGEENGVEILDGNKENAFKADIIHYPYFDFFFPTLKIIDKKKTVVTVHDCTPLVFPDQYPSGLKGKINLLKQKISLKKVSAIITDSESSKKDIVRYLHIPEEKIHVVYLAADSKYKLIKDRNKISGEINKKYNIKSKYLLYVGDVNYNKNISGIITAFNILSEEDSKLSLVLVGKSFENENLAEIKRIKEEIDFNNLSGKVKILGYVADDDLVKIYNLAEVFCLPSFYEGFGIGILEAMTCGCPVVTGNVSSMPEIAGDAAVLADPGSAREISSAINKILLNRDFRNKLIKLGLNRIKLFSWKKTAEKVCAVYTTLL